jgi:hypothetical protein
MTGLGDDRAATWYRRAMRIALPLGVVQLALAVFMVYELVAGVESVRPALLVQLALNMLAGVLLIWQGLQYRRRPRG